MKIHKAFVNRFGFTAWKTACGLKVRPVRLLLRLGWSSVTCKNCLKSKKDRSQELDYQELGYQELDNQIEGEGKNAD